MSDIPAGWENVRLGDIVWPSSQRVSPLERPDAPYIGLENVEPQSNRILGTVPASLMSSDSAVFEAGDVLYGRMRPYLNKVVRPSFAGLASAEFIIIPESTAIDAGFLIKRLSSADFVDYACSQYEGDRPRVKFDALAQFNIKLPPFPEQTRIVAKLEELLSDLDAGIAELKAAQNKLTQYRQSLLKAAVEGALTAEWRAQHPPTETGAQLLERILTERRARWEARQLAKFREQGRTPPKDWQKKYPEPVQLDLVGLASLPEGWVWTSLDALGEIASGVAKGTQRAASIKVREVPYLRVANVQRGFLDLSEVKTILATESDIADLTLEPGDILFNEGGDRDKLGRGWVWRNEVPNCIHQNHVFRMRPYLSETLPELISHHGNTFGKRWFQGAGKQTTNLASINLTMLRMFPVPLAPPAEQRQILLRLNIESEGIDRQSQAVALGLKQAAAQRQNILRAAFAGQLVPQDPNDEPASALLARIRAERLAQPETRKSRGRNQRESV